VVFAAEATQQENRDDSAGTTNPSLSTPNPGTNNTNTNNGNQYGLTPKPERTRQPGNDVSENNNNDEQQSNPGRGKNR
jgi:hypothetical protein